MDCDSTTPRNVGEYPIGYCGALDERFFRRQHWHLLIGFPRRLEFLLSNLSGIGDCRRLGDSSFEMVSK